MSANVSPLPPRNHRARSGERSGARNFVARAEAVAAIAEQFADEVDRSARFPAEAFAAIREQRLLGMLVSTELGGESARAADVGSATGRSFIDAGDRPAVGETALQEPRDG